MPGSTDMNKYRFHSTIVAGLIILSLFLAGCDTDYQARSVERMPENCRESSIVHDGLVRWYRICIPDPLPESVPLVLYLHGGTLSMRSLFSPLVDSSGTWFQIVDQEGMVLLVPNAVNPENGDTYGDDQNWNDLRPDQASGQTQADDVGFLVDLLD
jgi:poly(3-hydroxybutyrate) depolymerase